MKADSDDNEDCPGEDLLLLAALGEPSSESVQRHVAQCTRCRQSMGQLRREVGALRVAAACEAETGVWRAFASDAGMDDRPEQAVPTHIDRYRVVNRIAQSGQGTVYRVVHPTLPLELVAKVSNRTLAETAGAPYPLAEEARLLAELDHPNVAHVYDLGVHDGRPFLVMELIRGRHLGQYAADVKPTPSEIARIVAETARGLAAAHAIGLIHRDIKPANIVIDQQSRAKLVDFGLAHLRNVWSDRQSGLADLVGTPSYMAPEQAMGQAERIGPWTDIFGLGAVLYSLLVGHSPYKSPNGNAVAVLERVKRCEFDRQALGAASIPGRLRRICLKAMASEPSRRYVTAEAMAKDLERFDRHRCWRPVAATAVLTIALGFGAVAWYGQTRPESAALVLGAQPMLQVARFETRMTLADAIPLVNGDAVRVQCTVPAGTATSLFWFDSQGQLALLDQWPASEQATTLVYPPLATAELPTLSGPPGSEMVLVCGQRGESPARDEVLRLFDSAPLGNMPANSFILLTANRIETHVGTEQPRSLDSEHTVKDRLSRLEAVLESLRKRMTGRYDFVAGVVFPHAS